MSNPNIDKITYTPRYILFFLVTFTLQYIHKINRKCDFIVISDISLLIMLNPKIEEITFTPHVITFSGRYM